MFYVYMLRCSDDSLYTGWTTNLQKRLLAHNRGVGSKYTRARRPVAFVYFEKCESKSEALKREAEIKRLSRQEKLFLINSGENLMTDQKITDKEVIQ